VRETVANDAQFAADRFARRDDAIERLSSDVDRLSGLAEDLLDHLERQRDGGAGPLPGRKALRNQLLPRKAAGQQRRRLALLATVVLGDDAVGL
jgi:hypothetical protein